MDKEQLFSLFLGCVPTEVEEYELMRYFSKFGGISSIELKKRKNGKCIGFGYLHCNDKETQSRILANRHYLFGREFVVEPILEKEYLSKKKFDKQDRFISVSRLKRDEWDQHKFTDFFSQYGELEKCFLNPGSDELLTGCVTFTNPEGVINTLRCKKIRSKGMKVKAFLQKGLNNQFQDGTQMTHSAINGDSSDLPLFPYTTSGRLLQNLKSIKLLTFEHEESDFAYLQKSSYPIRIRTNHYHYDSNLKFNRTVRRHGLEVPLQISKHY